MQSYCYRYRVVSRSQNTADSFVHDILSSCFVATSHSHVPVHRSAYNLGFRCARDVSDDSS